MDMRKKEMHCYMPLRIWFGWVWFGYVILAPMTEANTEIITIKHVLL